MRTEAVPTQLTRAIRPFLSLALTQAAQIPSTEPLKSFSPRLVKRSGLSKFDDPQSFPGWRLDDVRSSVNRVASRGNETHLVDIGIATITSATILCVHTVIRAFGVVSIAVFESVATVCTRDVRKLGFDDPQGPTRRRLDNV